MNKIGVIIIVLVFVSIIVSTTWFVFNNNQEITFLEFEIISENDIRVGEETFFNVDDIPIDSNITWNIQNQSFFGNNIRLVFNESREFKIDVKIQWKNGWGTGNDTVIVKNSDFIQTDSGNNIFNLRPRWHETDGSVLTLEEGIINPNVQIDINVQFSGRIQIYIASNYINDSEVNIHFEDEFSGFNSAISKSYHLSRNDLPLPSDQIYLSISISIYNGNCDTWSVESTITY